MSDYDRWLAANDAFLSELVGWLRDRLEQLAADGGPPPQASAAAPDARQPGPRPLLERRRRGAVEPPPVDPVAVAATADPAVLAEAESRDEPPPLIMLSAALGLTAFQRDVLLLAVAMELDTRIAALCARAQHDPQRRFPTFALAMTLFDGSSWDVMSPEGPLRHWLLVDVDRTRGEPLTVSALRADERVVNYVKGLNHLDERLRPLLRPVPRPGDADLAPSQAAAAAAVVATVHRPVETRPALVQLLGSDAVGKRLVAARAAAELGLRLVELSADDLPASAAEVDVFARLWQRESLLSPLALLVDAADADRAGPAGNALRLWPRSSTGLVLLDVREPWPNAGDSAVALEVGRPLPAEQREAWGSALGDRAGELPLRLTAQFDLNLPTLHRIVRDALHGEALHDDAAPDDAQLEKALWNGCLAHTRAGLDQLAQRLDARATWDQLELPAEEERLLRRIESQVTHRGRVYDAFGFRARMNRGLGISVLFAGESGTGKTMAAEVLADSLGLMLYRIDLSAVVSKYIGETEKNLRKLFDAAEGGGAILFFDEADALFGKRSEVKDSHDRYANIEVNYLLQRMETFGGLAVLATNLKSAMDTAFLRRLRSIVDFPFPAVAQRAAIWSGVFPPDTPLGRLDIARLARLHLTGGSIANIALSAAFVAAAEGGPVTMPMVLDAARTEFRKLQKPVNEADFRWVEEAGGAA